MNHLTQFLCFLMFMVNFSIQTSEKSLITNQDFHFDRQTLHDYLAPYKHLEEGFEIIQLSDKRLPNFYEFMDKKIKLDKDGVINFSELILEAENKINESLQNIFYTMLQDEINQIPKHKNLSKLNMSSDRPIPYPDPIKNISPYYIESFSAQTVHDPLYIYVMKYKDYFLKPILREWVTKNQRQYLQLCYDAIIYNHIPLVTLLLSMELNPNQTINEQSLLGAAVSNQRPEITQALLSAGALTTARTCWPEYNPVIIEAARDNNIQIAQLLLEYQADPNVTNDKGQTSLTIAAENNYLELADLLLTHHANINQPTILQDYITQHYLNAHTEVFENIYTHALADSKPNFNIQKRERDIYGFTPLQLATTYNHESMVLYLIQHNADLNISNIFEGTALQIAQAHNYKKIADLLLQAGAIDYTPKNIVNTPLVTSQTDTILEYQNFPSFTFEHNDFMFDPL